MATQYDIKEYFNMNVSELSKEIGYSHSYLTNLSNGKTKTSLTRYIALRKSLLSLIQEIDNKEEEMLCKRKEKRKEIIKELLPIECISGINNVRDLHELL